MKTHHEFLDPICCATNLDSFGLRKAILESVRDQLANFSGTLLDIGCGNMPYKTLLFAPPSRVQNYIGLDLHGSIPKPDLEWDGQTIPLPDDSVDHCLATEVLEHVPDPEKVLREAWRVLKPVGRILFTAPFLWPLHCIPNDHCRYTPFSLERHLSRAGFEQIQLKSLGGWDASLAQMIGLWTMHRPMSSLKRTILSRAALPAVRYLMQRDQPPSVFKEGLYMITGISGTALKPAATGNKAEKEGDAFR